MQAVLDGANGAAGVRLLQDAFNMRSIALYASLGFEVREPLLVMTGRPSEALPAGVTVRPMEARDIERATLSASVSTALTRRRPDGGAASVRPT